MDNLTSGKVGALFALIALTFIFGSVPYFLVLRSARSVMSTRRQEQVIKYLNCFGGGVFLGALLLHLMVEGSEEFDEFKEEAGFDNEYPFFNLFVAAGFFAVAFIEYFIHSFLAPHRDDGTGRSSCHSHHDEQVNEEASGVKRSPSLETGLTGTSGYYGSLASTPAIKSDDPHHGTENGGNHGASSLAQRSEIATSQENSSPSSEDKGCCENGRVTIAELESSCVVTYTYASTASPIRAFLLLVAFSFHTIFDGLAVGLQDSTFQLWEMFAAISIHKCIVAFCLGMELFSKFVTSPKKAFLWIGIFSLMSPIGICIGIYLTSGGVNSEARHLSSGILQGLASGTFMYVTFLEILSYFWNNHQDRHFLDIIFALLGFGCMAGVKYLDKD